MKKVIITFAVGTVCVLIIPYLLSYRFHYPLLPFENMTKREVVEKINDADNRLVKLTTENGHEWFITSERNIAAVDEMIKELVSKEGWVFELKEGSGLIFEKQGERLIVTTQKWTGDYVLCQIPAYFNE